MWLKIALSVLLVVATLASFDAYPTDYYSALQHNIPYDEYRNLFNLDRQDLGHMLLGGNLKRTSNQAYRLFGGRAALDSLAGLGFGRARKNEDSKDQARYGRTLNSLVLGGGFKRSGQKISSSDKQNPELEEPYLNKHTVEDKQQQQETDQYRPQSFYLYKNIPPSAY